MKPKIIYCPKHDSVNYMIDALKAWKKAYATVGPKEEIEGLYAQASFLTERALNEKPLSKAIKGKGAARTSHEPLC